MFRKPHWSAVLLWILFMAALLLMLRLMVTAAPAAPAPLRRTHAVPSQYPRMAGDWHLRLGGGLWQVELTDETTDGGTYTAGTETGKSDWVGYWARSPWPDVYVIYERRTGTTDPWVAFPVRYDGVSCLVGDVVGVRGDQLPQYRWAYQSFHVSMKRKE